MLVLAAAVGRKVCYWLALGTRLVWLEMLSSSLKIVFRPVTNNESLTIALELVEACYKSFLAVDKGGILIYELIQ